MASPMASAGADLGMKPAAPNCCARRMTRGWSLDEMMTTGTSGYSPRTCSRAEKPRAPGMLRSSSTSSISGCSCSAWPRVAALAASRVRNWGRRPCSTCSTAARNRGWSSATRSVGSVMGSVCHGARGRGGAKGHHRPCQKAGCAYCCLRYSIHSRTRRGMCLRWGNTT